MEASSKRFEEDLDIIMLALDSLTTLFEDEMRQTLYVNELAKIAIVRLKILS